MGGHIWKKCKLVAIMVLKVCVILFGLKLLFLEVFLFSIALLSTYYACTDCTTLTHSATAVATFCSPKTGDETVTQLYLE